MIGESLIPQQLDVGASPAFVGLTLTGLTTGYVPYKSATTLANSPIFISTTNVGIGVTVPIASASGNILFRMSGRGYYTGSWQANNSAAIDIIAAEAFADSATLGAYIAFSTRATGGGTPALTERLRISSLGSLLINGDEGSGTSGKLSITNSVSTGAGSALLGTNSPAGTLAAPFTWLVFY